MGAGRFFLDTSFVQALLNRQDRYHTRAQMLLPQVRTANEVWTTEEVLIEVGNALSTFNRLAAVQFIEQCYRTANMRVMGVDRTLLLRALHLYHSRPDKTWGLTDCISFVVMQDQGLTEAVTADRHFLQAGFHALLLASST